MSDVRLPELAERLVAAVGRRWPGARLADLAPLHGGISSLTFTARLHGAGEAERRVVIKMAPPGLAPVRNRDVLRQARVLAALHGAPGVRVPEVLATDDGTPPLFVMEHVDGRSYEPRWDLSDAPPAPTVVDARARAAARMLAALGAVDPAGVGLGDEPVLSPGDELTRWARLYGTVAAQLREGEDALRRALEARVPDRDTGARSAILHGDYRLGNCLFAGEHLAAIIDWEIWSVGDARNDLAWLMVFCDPVMERVVARDAANAAAAEAIPGAGELLAEYVIASGLDGPPADLAWFEALCRYKLGATMSVLAKRNRRLQRPDPTLEVAALTTPPLLARGLALLDRGGDGTG